MTSPPRSEAAGLYVHLPFCRKKCSYCNFRTAPLSRLVPAYLDAVTAEARLAAEAEEPAWGEGFDTLYLGGGTPSLLPPQSVAALSEGLRSLLRVDSGAEFTLESNPEDVTPAAAADWRSAGVTRVTVGVQTIHPSTLERMQRAGDAAASEAATASLRSAGIDNVALDLIAGLPGEGPAEWEASLAFAIGLRPRHLSLYLLETDGASMVGRHTRAGRWQLPDEDELADFYLAARGELEHAGLIQYEISNFAVPGFESRHNRKYWSLLPYLGLGMAAHSFDGRRRWWNEPNLKDYLAAVREGRRPVAGGEEDDPDERNRERIVLGLRQRAGVSLAALAAHVEPPVLAAWRGRLKIFVEAGLVLDDNDALRLTPRGMLLSNEIFQALFDADSPASLPEK